MQYDNAVEVSGRMSKLLCVLLLAMSPLISQARPLSNPLLDKVAAGNSRYLDNCRTVTCVECKGTAEAYDRLKPPESQLILREEGATKYDRVSGLFLTAYTVPVNRTEAGRDDHCFGINSRYVFHLTKTSADQTWKLDRFVITRDPNADMIKLGFSARHGRPNQATPWTSPDIPALLQQHLSLEEVIRLPNLTIQSVNESLEKESVSIRFSYDYRRSQESETVPQFETEIVFRGSEYWLPVKLQQAIEINGESHVQECEQSRVISNGLPMSRAYHFTYKVIGANGRTTWYEEGHDERTYHYVPIPEAEFMLSAFGLPEPAGVGAGIHIPAYGWIMIAAAVCGGLWFLVRRRREGAAA